MKRFYSLKHAKETTGKLAKCSEHENGKMLVSVGWSGFPLLIKEDNKSVLNTQINYTTVFPSIHSVHSFIDIYKELPPGTTVIFTQDSLS